jgi:hypothetical protein
MNPTFPCSSEVLRLGIKWQGERKLRLFPTVIPDLSDAKLSEADLRGANLSVTVLNSANLSRANLSGVDLRGANLWRADLDGANFEMAAIGYTIFGRRSLILHRA